MSLITKAIEKAERDAVPPPQPEIPTPSRGKKKVVIFLGALALVGVALGLVYLFLLRSAPEAPKNVVHRSISARKKPPKMALVQSQPNKADSSVRAAEEEKIPPENVSKEPSVAPTPAKDANVIAKEEKKVSAPKQELLSRAPENQTAEAGQEPASPEPEAGLQPERSVRPTGQKSKLSAPRQEPLSKPRETQPAQSKPEPAMVESAAELSAKPSVLSSSVQQGGIAEDTILGEEKIDSLPSSLPAKIPSPAHKDTSAKQVIPSNPGPFKSRLVQRPLGIADKSVSRAERFFRRGVDDQQQGELDRAIEAYRKTLSFDPHHEQARLNLATACMQLGKFKEAEQELMYLWALKPKDPKILFNFGLLLYQTGDHASAETKLKKLLEFDPYHLEGNLLLATLYQENGEYDKAVELCLKAYRINSTDPRVLYKLGRAFDGCGDGDNAAKYYRLFLFTNSEREEKLRSSVQDRLNYLLSQKEGR
ncbi:MAG: tetratricopeptide repeat protein [Candidatus Zixiibacteriota bacterium]